MFTEIFIKSLVNFLYLTLHKQPVTKARIKKNLILFLTIWITELMKSKKNAKKI